jgi:hypothetical protein
MSLRREAPKAGATRSGTGLNRRPEATCVVIAGAPRAATEPSPVTLTYLLLGPAEGISAATAVKGRLHTGFVR